MTIENHTLAFLFLVEYYVMDLDLYICTGCTSYAYQLVDGNVGRCIGRLHARQG